MDTAPVICRIHVSITSTSYGQIHVLCLRFKTVIFIVADLEISVSVCLYYYVWELWFGSRCCTRVRKQEAMELNGCEGLEIAKQCKIIYIVDPKICCQFWYSFSSIFVRALFNILSHSCIDHKSFGSSSAPPIYLKTDFMALNCPIWTQSLSSDHWISKIFQSDFYCNLSTLYLRLYDGMRFCEVTNKILLTGKTLMVQFLPVINLEEIKNAETCFF
jgi:hypothetical protein